MFYVFVGEKYKLRWRSIRDAYVKFLRRKAEEERSGSGSSKRKDYQFAQQLTFLNASVEPRETQDNFEAQEHEEAEAADTSEDFDDETMDANYIPERRRRQSLHAEERDPTDLYVEEDMEDEVAGLSAPAPTDESPPAPTTEPEQQMAEERQEQPPRRSTPMQSRGRGEEATPTGRRRVAPVHPPTRRETEAEMSGAVSGLLGILQSHKALITRQMQDGDRGHLIEQYKSHIHSLQTELQSVHDHYREEIKMRHEEHREEIKMMHEVYSAQFDQLRVEHHQAVAQLQQMMQQMHQHSSELLKLQAHPAFHTAMSLLPFFEKVPSNNMMACHSSVLDAIKQHMETPLILPPTFRHSQPALVPHWQSSSQSYTGFRGSQYTPLLSGSSTSTASTQDSHELQTPPPIFSTAVDPDI
ncbi:uncharacterized protein [Hyperolius riggenbachi]|uniref:uncharacterized protein n=1 Tax=Hyperolius riggenbachi TaxID=752182 RepID=UPI0035A2854E